MEFLFDGKTWDTDKKVYVAGFVLIKTWFPLHKSGDWDVEKKIQYNPKCRQGYISELHFDYNNGQQSFVKNITVFIPKECKSYNANDCFVASSMKELHGLLKGVN